MAASRNDVDRWINTAREGNFEFIISVCDTFDYEDYPVYCKDEEELKQEIPFYNGKKMQRINEIIRIKPDGMARENLSIYDF